ncbi:MAG: hypothetical protein RIF33_18515 [Cyclobacteriaceae bacterium]
MEREENTRDRFVLKLINDTKRGVLHWTAISPERTITPFNERIISTVYKTVIDSKSLRIYKYTANLSELGGYQLHTTQNTQTEVKVRLELIDYYENPLYTFVSDHALHTLFNAISESNSGVEELMENYLKAQ